MDDYTLEEYQRRSGNQISQDMIGQCARQEQRVRTGVEKQWQTAHKHLVVLLRLLDQDFDEACEKSNTSLETFSDDELARLIQGRLRIYSGVRAKNQEINEIPSLRDEVRDLRELNNKLTEDLSRSQEVIQKLRADFTALEVHLSVFQQIQGNKPREDPPENTDKDFANTIILPDWFKTWQASRNFEKSSMAILIMGDTGLALRPSIIKQMSKRLSVSETDINLDEAIYWLMHPEEYLFPILVQEIAGITTGDSSAGGNQPAVLQLTADGQMAYQCLAGKTPKENQYEKLIKSHSSPEQTILNLQAVEILADEGYQIRSQAQAIQLSNGETYIPDILAVDPKTGEFIFIEVERDVHKDLVSRKLKWMKLFEASLGNLYVLCDNLNCQRAIQGEINLALNGLSFRSFLTNLHGLRTGKRSEKDGSIWLSQHHEKNSGNGVHSVHQTPLF